MSTKVVPAYLLYLLALTSGLSLTILGLPFLWMIFLFSMLGGVGFETFLIGFFTLLWITLIPFVLVTNMNRMLRRSKECIVVGGMDGLRLFFNHESGFNDISLAIGVVLSSWWVFSITIWYPSFFPEINFFVGGIGFVMFLSGMIPMPKFLRLGGQTKVGGDKSE